MSGLQWGPYRQLIGLGLRVLGLGIRELRGLGFLGLGLRGQEAKGFGGEGADGG